MAKLTHLPEAAFRKMPWRNGGGETSEIAIFPAAASLDDFIWRISSATVRQSGLFSQFPGIDRTLCVVEGEGIDLAFPDAITAKLDLSSVPYRFAGELYVKGTVVAPGIIDFNAMTRRNAARHTVARRHIVAETDIAVPGDFLLVYTLQMPLVARCGVMSYALARGDALLVADAVGQTLSLATQTPGIILIVDLWLV